MSKRIDHIPEGVLDAFVSYSWPGNVRELQNLIERAVIRSNNGVLPNPLPDKNPVMVPPSRDTFTASTRSADSARVVLDGLGYRRSRWRRRPLGLKRTTLIAKMKKLGISSGRRSKPRQLT